MLLYTKIFCQKKKGCCGLLVTSTYCCGRRRWPWAARTLERKFYFDEAYDLAFYEPASRKAVFLTRYVEQPIFLASLGELGSSVRGASRRLSSLQTGYVREYAFALAAGLAVLAIVFILVT